MATATRMSAADLRKVAERAQAAFSDAQEALALALELEASLGAAEERLAAIRHQIVGAEARLEELKPAVAAKEAAVAEQLSHLQATADREMAEYRERADREKQKIEAGLQQLREDRERMAREDADARVKLSEAKSELAAARKTLADLKARIPG